MDDIPDIVAPKAAMPSDVAPTDGVIVADGRRVPFLVVGLVRFNPIPPGLMLVAVAVLFAKDSLDGEADADVAVALAPTAGGVGASFVPLLIAVSVVLALCTTVIGSDDRTGAIVGNVLILVVTGPGGKPSHKKASDR